MSISVDVVELRNNRGSALNSASRLYKPYDSEWMAPEAIRSEKKRRPIEKPPGGTSNNIRAEPGRFRHVHHIAILAFKPKSVAEIKSPGCARRYRA
jgi:hypothetical protein